MNNKNGIRFLAPPLPNPRLEPMLELISNREAVVEGCSGITEYNDRIATVSCRALIITFRGFDISLKALGDNCISVSGCFSDISFSPV